MGSETTYVFIFIAFILAFAFELIFGMSAYQLQQKNKYSFFNRYPFEMAEGAKKWFLPFHYILVGASVILMVAFAYLYYGKLDWSHYQLIGTITTIIIAVCIFLLFTMTTKYVRFRLIIMAVLSLATIANSAMIGTYYLTFAGGFEYSIWVAILAFIPAFIVLIALTNSNLYKTTITDKRIRQDGILEITRPNKYAPAYTEWLLIFVNVAMFILVNIINFAH